METTLELHKSNITVFLDRLNDLNKKLAKKNQPKVEFFVSEVTCRDSLMVTLTTEMKTANIKGVDVHFEGVVDLVNQEEESKVFHLDNPEIHNYLTDCECDECHKKIGRNKYIVFSKKGADIKSRNDLIVLGTTCAKNYFPFSIESYIGYVGDEFEAMAKEFDESFGEFSYLNDSVDFEKLYYATCDATNNLSFYLKDGETKTDVCNLIFDKDYHHSIPKVDFNTVKEWLIGAYSNNDSEFGMNVRSVIMETGCYVDKRFTPYDTPKLRERISIKQMGLAIYAFIGAKKWYDKEVEKKLAAERKLAEDAVIEYFGNVGDKFEKELVFDKSYSYESVYGFQYIHIFHDEENHVFKWSTANGTYQAWHKTNCKTDFFDYKPGMKYTIKGTIKAHSEYNGIKQTVITRCKVLKDEVETHVFSKKEIEKAMEVMDSVEQSA